MSSKEEHNRNWFDLMSQNLRSTNGAIMDAASTQPEGSALRVALIGIGQTLMDIEVVLDNLTEE